MELKHKFKNRKKLFTLTTITVVALLNAPQIYALNIIVNSTSSGGGAGTLRNALFQLNLFPAQNDTIEFQLPEGSEIAVPNFYFRAIRKNPGVTVGFNTVGAQPHITIQGNDTDPALFLYQGDITLNNLTLANGTAVGGTGGTGRGGGGGGLGAGGGAFVGNGGAGGLNVVFNNVNFINNGAQGGTGGAIGANTLISGGGGGGLGGPGGSALTDIDGGGGGGGVGGPGTVPANAARGGDGNANNGGPGKIHQATGGDGGGPGGNGGTQSGGGGGGGRDPTLGSGGGGGVGGANGTDGTDVFGGIGAFGGGGGGSVGNPVVGVAPNGGFGGGGGGSGSGGGAGIGGFGAGNGGGVGIGGGGGSGYGGGLFVDIDLTLTTSNRNTVFSGNSVLAGNGVNGGANGQSGGQDIFIHGSNTVTFNVTNGFTQTISGTIASDAAGAITKLGTSTLIYANTMPHTYIGATTITAGTLRTDAVNNMPMSSTVNVGANGVFYTNNFNQTVGGLNNSGYVIPVMSSITAVDQFTQSATGTFLTTILDTNNFGRLTSVVGGGLVEGNVQVSVLNNGFTIMNGDTFQILTNIDPASNPALIQPSLPTLRFVRDPAAPSTIYRLRAIRTTFEQIILNPILQGVANALDVIRGQNPSPGLTNILRTLDSYGTNRALIENALFQLLPQGVNGAEIFSTYQNLDFMLPKISERLDKLRLGFDQFQTNNTGYVAGDPYYYYNTSNNRSNNNSENNSEREVLYYRSQSKTYQTYSSYVPTQLGTYGPIVYGNYSKQDTQFGLAGYTAKTMGGGIMGDAPICSWARLGGGVTYTHTSTQNNDQAANTLGINSTQAIIYGGLHYNLFFMDGTAYFGVNNYTGKRNILFINQVATSDYMGYQNGVYLRGGMSFPFFTMDVAPIVTLQQTNVYIQSYAEKGAEGANLAVESHDISLLEGGIGFRIIEASQPETFLPEFHCMLVNTFSKTELPINARFVEGGPNFLTVGPAFPKHGLNIGASVITCLTNGTFLSASYDFHVRSKFVANTGTLRIRWTF